MDRFDIVNKFKNVFFYVAIAFAIILFLLNISTSMFFWSYIGRIDETISGSALFIVYILALLVRLLIIFFVLYTLMHLLLKLMRVYEERKILKSIAESEVIEDVKERNTIKRKERTYKMRTNDKNNTKRI